MEINDQEYTFAYKKGETTAAELAKKFCVEKGADLGFTQETIGNCVKPLMSEISKALSGEHTSNGQEQGQERQFSEEGIRQIPLEINGVTYIFEYHDDMDVQYASTQLASEFCSTKGVEIGISPLLENGSVDSEGALEQCIDPLRKALHTEIESMRAAT
jgi:hypothetical protein